MFLDPFFTDADGAVRITAQQASSFAKDIAGDFNPIHDPEAKRFCVPADLVFALTLARYGVSERMCFSFTGMLGDGTRVSFPGAPGALIELTDEAGKTYVRAEREGETCTDLGLIERLVRSYVAFSGQNFPNILVPLMERHGVMINPDRPMVIYESMSFELNHLSVHHPELELTGATLEASGKRGDARLHFRIFEKGRTVGTGSKKLVLSGLREYDADALGRFVTQYIGRQKAYQAAGV